MANICLVLHVVTFHQVLVWFVPFLLFPTVFEFLLVYIYYLSQVLASLIPVTITFSTFGSLSFHFRLFARNVNKFQTSPNPALRFSIFLTLWLRFIMFPSMFFQFLNTNQTWAWHDLSLLNKNIEREACLLHIMFGLL